MPTERVKMCGNASYSVSVFIWRSGGRPEASQVAFGPKLQTSEAGQRSRFTCIPGWFESVRTRRSSPGC